MTSADFCLNNHRITPLAAMSTQCVCYLIRVSYRPIAGAIRLDLVYPGSPTGHLTQRATSHVKQISPDKDMNCRSTTASFTVSAEPWASLSCANLPTDSAFYDVSVRRLTALLQTSSRPRLATTPLSFANGCSNLKINTGVHP